MTENGVYKNMGLEIDYSTFPVLQKIHDLLPNLSKTEQRVASYILENSEKVTSFTVSDLAEGSGASDATVVRTCKSLGFSSFQDFKVSMARNLASPLRTSFSAIAPGDPPDVVVDKIFQENINTLQLTHSVICSKQMAKAASFLQEARRVLILGLGESNAVAVDLQHKLMRLGMTAFAYTDSYLQQMAAVIADENDVVVAISHQGDSIDVVEATRLCKARGARVVSITSAAKSPLAKASDVTLTTVSRETQFRMNSISSRLAQFTIIDCLCNILYLEKLDCNEIFYEIDEALKRRRL